MEMYINQGNNVFHFLTHTVKRSLSFKFSHQLSQDCVCVSVCVLWKVLPGYSGGESADAAPCWVCHHEAISQSTHSDTVLGFVFWNLHQTSAMTHPEHAHRYSPTWTPGHGRTRGHGGTCDSHVQLSRGCVIFFGAQRPLCAPSKPTILPIHPFSASNNRPPASRC